ncbi:MAG TPA: SurA N-terminal domain-containing protein [Pyrinomonadaceae bacterium]|nr:SurA N-terminal domain-containing protein [Pyrinomonadaceae bacterium]
MLKFFNRLERTRNFVLIVFGVLMVASLVLFYAPTRGDNVNANLARSEDAAASVSGEKVTVGEVFRQKQMISQYMQGRPYPAKTVLNSLIGSRITRVEAARLGLTASDTEVANAIREQFKPQDGQPFDQKRYEQMAMTQSGSIAAFEEDIRDSLSAEKLRAFITSGVTVSEEEVLKDFQRKNTKFDLSYVLVNPADLSQSITPSDADLRDYFEKNKQTYFINAPQKKIKYVFLSTAKIGEKLPITDADLQAEYDKLPADKKIGGVMGQEIVLRVPKPEQDGVVLEKATNLVTQLRKDSPTVSEEAFGELAKGQSENPASAASGGKLKGPVRENLNNQTDPYQRLIKMQPGEITEPINYQGRYFILRRGDAVPKTFEDAKKEIEVSLRNRRAYGVTAELAQRVTDALKQNKDVDATAKQFAGEANMPVGEMVRETAYVKPGDDVPDVGVSPQFEEGIAMLVNAQDVGDKIPVQNGFAMPLLVDKKDPRDAEFDEVRAQLIDVVKLEKAKAQIADIANQIASGAVNVGALAGSATAKGLKAEESKAFILGSPLGKGTTATTNEALEDAIYALKQGETTKTPIQIGDLYYIVGVNSREEANMADFAKQRSTLMEQMAGQKRGQVFSDYLASTRQKLEAAGSITIYKDAIAKLDSEDLPFQDLLNQ